MNPRLVLALVLGIALVAAPGAAGKLPLGGVELCGAADACVRLPDAGLERVWVATTHPGPVSEAAPFYVLRWRWGEQRPAETAYYVPSHRAMRWQVQGPPEIRMSWREVGHNAVAVLARAARGLRPLAAPAPTRVSVGGRVVRAPVTYLRLFKGVHAWTWPATPWLPVTFEAAAPSPWTDGRSMIALSRLPGFVAVDGWVYRIPKAVARRALKGLPLTARR